MLLFVFHAAEEPLLAPRVRRMRFTYKWLVAARTMSFQYCLAVLFFMFKREVPSLKCGNFFVEISLRTNGVMASDKFARF